MRVSTENCVRYLSFTCAFLLVLIILFIFYFVGSRGILPFTRQGVSLLSFFTTSNWNPGSGNIGASGLILGSVVTTGLAVLFATPLAICTAVFLVDLAPKSLVSVLQPAVELFVGIPSVVFGFLGLEILVPFIAKTANVPIGEGWLAGSLVLAVMILPTITSLSIDVLRSVPGSIREASLALGATWWQTLRSAVIPASIPGLLTAVILGLARAIGETLAVQMVLGGQPVIPHSLIAPASNITSVILTDSGETIPGTLENNVLWSLALVLLLSTFIFVAISRYFSSRRVYR